MSIQVLYEDNHLIAVYKPAGTLVQGDVSGDASLMDEVKEYIKKTYNKTGNVFLGLVHRLDRNVAGIVLFAKTTKGASRISEQFRNHTVEKIYHARVEGIIKNKKGTLVNVLQRDEKRNKAQVFSEDDMHDGDRAELSYECVESKFGSSLLKIRLETGKHHQIRAQFAAIGHPILGDVKYGAKKAFPDQHIALYATELHFDMATANKDSGVIERKVITIPVPVE